MDTWSFTWALRNLIAELLIPPGIWMLLILLVVILLKKRQTLQRVLIATIAIMLWVTSTNYFAIQLTHLGDYFLGWPQPLSIDTIREDAHKPQAIIILGGGKRKGAMDSPFQFEGHDVSSATMDRLRLGARLVQKTRLPILVTGGSHDKTSRKDLSEAQFMSWVMEYELAIKPKWIEDQSKTTQENAKLSVNILKKENIQIIYLVTHFWHMPRAKALFQKEGIVVVEAPMGFYQEIKFNPLDFYPSGGAIEKVRWVWREFIGIIWYSIKT